MSIQLVSKPLVTFDHYERRGSYAPKCPSQLIKSACDIASSLLEKVSDLFQHMLTISPFPKLHEIAKSASRIRALMFHEELLKPVSIELLTNSSLFDAPQSLKERSAYERIQKALASSGLNVTFHDDRCELSFLHHENEIKALFEQKRLQDTISDNFTLSASGDDSPLLRQTTIHPGTPFTVSYHSQKALQKRMAEFSQKIEEFHESAQGETITIQEPYPTHDILKSLLDRYPGICVGEIHEQILARKIILEALPELKKNGLTTLFMEHLFYDSQQKWLDTYVQSEKDAPLPPSLDAYLDFIDKNLVLGSQLPIRKQNCYKALVQKAKEVGIRIVGIDTTLGYHFGSPTKHGSGDIVKRCKAMSMIAYHIMSEEIHGGKFIALMGSSHVANCNKVIGIAPLLHVPSVIMEEARSTKASITQFNVAKYKEIVEGVSVYISA